MVGIICQPQSSLLQYDSKGLKKKCSLDNKLMRIFSEYKHCTLYYLIIGQQAGSIKVKDKMYLAEAKRPDCPRYLRLILEPTEGRGL